MREIEKDIVLRMANEFPKLSENKQNYILGYVECLASLSEEKKDKESREVQCV